MKNDTKRSRLPLAAGLILFAAAALWALTRSFGCGTDSIPGATNKQRIAYIESFGWDPGFTHTAVENVRIPVEFDDVYEEYNALQRKQGFDLRKYRAHTPSSATPTSFPVIRRFRSTRNSSLKTEPSSAQTSFPPRREDSRAPSR